MTKSQFSVHDNRYIFFIETKILIILLHSSAVIAVIQGKLKIENSSMKANLDRCLYDSQIGLYLDPYYLYWLYISIIPEEHVIFVLCSTEIVLVLEATC